MASGVYARIAADLAAETRAFRLLGPQVRLAVCASLGATIAVLAALALHLDDPWWAGISAVSIMQSGRSATWSRAVDRVAGTYVGALVGFLFAPLVADRLLFELACAGVATVTIYWQERSLRNYAILLGGVTAMLVMFGTLQTPGQSLQLAVYRSLEVTVGILSGACVSYLFHSGGSTSAARTSKGGLLGRPIDTELLGVALMGGLAIAAIPTIWTKLDLPSLGQTPITAFVVMTAFRGDPRLKAVARLFGCLLGGAYGILAVGLVGDAFAPWLACLVVGLFIATFLQHGGGDASYVGQQAAVALLMAMVSGPAATVDLLPSIDRLVGIIGGVLVISLTTAFLNPIRLRFFPPARADAPGPT